ncbi:MAG TPA: NAD(P)-binding domain-containing protein, partial [Bacillota bacterium]|nr:NAD(P)-binding domain-containing protein [Bacillota bacterium]
MKNDSIGFIGAGSIARTMIAGLVSKGVTDRKRIWVTNRQNRESLQKLREEFGVNFTYSKKELLENAGIIIIAVKPSDITTVLEEIKPVVDESQLLISV